MGLTFLMIGGNSGDRDKYLDEAKIQIERNIGHIESGSSVFETEPWGFAAENLFLNQALEVSTIRSPFEVMAEIKKIETSLGRVRGKVQYISRTIDIDILLYNNLIINTPDLIIPHPEMINRRFVLKPLAQIAPSIVHPVFNKSISDLLKECRDNCKVEELPNKTRHP